MSVPYLHLGAVSKAYEHNLNVLAQTRAVSRLWQKDLSLWPTYGLEDPSRSTALNWLDLADQLETAVKQVLGLASNVSELGFQHIVFLSVSSSTLAAELIPALGLPTCGAHFHVLNRLEPLALHHLESNLDLTRTLFVVASKSGKHLEVHAVLLYFLAKLKAAGVASPGTHFVAITEDRSYLAALAVEHGFRAVISEPHGFSVRFSGVQHYGILLAGFCGLDLRAVLAGIRSVRQECARSEPIDQNPAATIAAFLAAIAQTGFYRLFFHAPPKFTPLLRRIGHLVGCSSCKDAKGILPFLDAHIPDPLILEKSFAVCTLNRKEVSALAPLQPDTPSISIDLNNLEDIPAETFKWELAVSLACNLLTVNPFEDPDFLDGRVSAMRYVAEMSPQQKWAMSRPRITVGALSLYVEGDLRHDVSSINLESALESFLSLCAPDGYCAFLNFLPDTPEVSQCLNGLLNQVSMELMVPGHLAFGPRYLHLIGQCYKGGPRGGIALMLTGDSTDRIDVPGAGYTLADLRLALALGDMDAMVAGNRPIVRLHLAGALETSLSELETVLLKALSLHRRAS